MDNQTLFGNTVNDIQEAQPNPCVRDFGKGPAGATCERCIHLFFMKHSSRAYFKCDQRKLTFGPGSDHRVSWDACSRYQVRVGK